VCCSVLYPVLCCVVTLPLPVEPKGHEVDPIRPGIKALTRTGSELVLREEEKEEKKGEEEEENKMEGRKSKRRERR
jgi:hypothetical protein